MLHILSILKYIRKHPLVPKRSNYTASPHGKNSTNPPKTAEKQPVQQNNQKRKNTAENSISNDVHWKKLRTLRT